MDWIQIRRANDVALARWMFGEDFSAAYDAALEYGLRHPAGRFRHDQPLPAPALAGLADAAPGPAVRLSPRNCRCRVCEKSEAERLDSSRARLECGGAPLGYPMKHVTVYTWVRIDLRDPAKSAHSDFFSSYAEAYEEMRAWAERHGEAHLLPR